FTITDDEFIVDYTGSAPQAPGPVNNTWCGLVSAVRQVFMSITNPGVQATEGCFRRIRIICPEGTILRARRPAPVSSYYEAMITDRKSTRLNSSHVKISYAVFC